jgi:hypothetical protein
VRRGRGEAQGAGCGWVRLAPVRRRAAAAEQGGGGPPLPGAPTREQVDHRVEKPLQRRALVVVAVGVEAEGRAQHVDAHHRRVPVLGGGQQRVGPRRARVLVHAQQLLPRLLAQLAVHQAAHRGELPDQRQVLRDGGGGRVRGLDISGPRRAAPASRRGVEGLRRGGTGRRASPAAPAPRSAAGWSPDRAASPGPRRACRRATSASRPPFAPRSAGLAAWPRRLHRRAPSGCGGERRPGAQAAPLPRGESFRGAPHSCVLAAGGLAIGNNFGLRAAPLLLAGRNVALAMSQSLYPYAVKVRWGFPRKRGGRGFAAITGYPPITDRVPAANLSLCLTRPGDPPPFLPKPGRLGLHPPHIPPGKQLQLPPSPLRARRSQQPTRPAAPNRASGPLPQRSRPPSPPPR